MEGIYPSGQRVAMEESQALLYFLSAWCQCGVLKMRKTYFVAVLAACLLAVASARDYYDILHVHRQADDSTIKRAYRKLALKMHPDKVQGSDEEKKAAAEKFAEVSHAYEVLTNPEKRKIYDRYGEEGLKSMDGGGGGGGGHPNDIFSQFFGGAFGFGFGDGEEQTPKGDTVYAELEVTLKDLYLGNTFRVVRDKNVLKPAPGKRQCNCRNKVVAQQIGPGMYQQYQQRVCEECPNLRLERAPDALSVAVEPGMADGTEISFFEEGEPLIDGEPGDLIFVLRTQPHPRFVRNGDNLHVTEVISLVDALAGFSRELEHLDGHKVELKGEGVTRPGQVVRIKGEGMPVFEKRRRGDLYVTYTVAFPTEVSAEQAKQLREMFGKAEFKPLDTQRHDEL